MASRRRSIRWLTSPLIAIAQLDVELGALRIEARLERAHVRLRAEAVRDQTAVGDPAEQRLHLRMIDAQRGEAVERDVLDEGLERGAHGVEGAVELHVLGVDVGDHRRARRQAHEGAVGLVGLDHHPVAFAVAGVGAVGVDDAAVDHGRIELRGIQQRRDQRGRGGLAVGAGDRDRPLQAHQLAEHLGAPDHRHAGAARRLDLGVVALDRRGHDDHAALAEIGRAMADRHGDAEPAQALDVGVLGDVGALHAMAEVVEHLGDPAHADAADPDEVDAARIERQGPHARASICVLIEAAAASDWSASASALAASVRPSAAARPAIAASSCG